MLLALLNFEIAFGRLIPGVRDRAAHHKIAVGFDANLEDEPPHEWVADLEQLIFRGGRFIEEVVFFHRKSATLFLADLIENFELNKVSQQLHWLLKLGGVADPDGKLPLDLRMTFLWKKEQARSCLQRILQWNPEKGYPIPRSLV